MDALALPHLRVRSRRENQIGDVGRQRAVFLGLGACRQPVGMSRERVPLLFALRKIIQFSFIVVRNSDLVFQYRLVRVRLPSSRRISSLPRKLMPSSTTGNAFSCTTPSMSRNVISPSVTWPSFTL